MDSSNQRPSGSTSPDLEDSIRRAKRHSQALTGVVLVVVGLLFLVDQLSWEWRYHLSFGRLWPVILIFMGLGIMFSHRDGDVIVRRVEDGTTRADFRPRGRRRLGDGFFLLLVGVVMLLHINHVVPLSHSWPVFIIAGGLSMMFGRGDRNWRRREYR